MIFNYFKILFGITIKNRKPLIKDPVDFKTV